MKPETGPGPSCRTRSSPQVEFQLLTMTELRTRPGEILDRVADDGAAFILERSGHRKACLVPVSLFLPDVSPERIAAELEDLEQGNEKPLFHVCLVFARLGGR